MPKCEHGLTSAECYVCVSPKYGAEPVQEPDLSRCPKCNGPADNGHDRSIPPSPYFCTKCMAEPVPIWKTLAATGAAPCVPSPAIQMVTQQAEPERNFCPRCGKRLHGEGIHTCTPPQTKCEHCSSPLFAATTCRVCGRKEAK